jgi:hypothetical protein
MVQNTPPNAQREEAARLSPSGRARPRFSAQDRARRKNHGLTGHLSTLLLQPRLFFYTFPETRHWLIVAALSLVVVGYLAVQAGPQVGSATPPMGISDPGMMPPVFDVGGSDPFNPPLPVDPSGGFGGAGGVPAADTTSQVTTAVTAGAMLVGIWGAQALLLLLVPLLNGRAPSFGRGFQIAVWASVPLVLMLIVQTIYHNAGGIGDSPGVSALLTRWDDYDMQPADVQWLLMSAASQVTIWRLWALALLYFGAREALKGRRLTALFVCALWIGIAVVTPVMMGMTPLPTDDAPPGVDMPPMDMPSPIDINSDMGSFVPMPVPGDMNPQPGSAPAGGLSLEPITR